MLSEKIKKVIRSAYKSIGQNLTNFTPRQQQTFLIAEIAKTLAGEYNKQRKIITFEAGTGTGKSLAYSLGTIPLAISREKKVIISTATVALQEQLVDKDLPFLKKHSGLAFNFTLVKGRQRYVCRQKLASAISQDNDNQLGFIFAEKPKAKDIRTLNKMHQALQDHKWSGDIDSWPHPIDHKIWQQIQSDKHTCLKHLSGHHHCPFHLARETVEAADVLIVNHSLLLADLSLGGGIILPDPEQSYYVIDEAHHLPKITREHSSANITLKGAIDWLEKISDTGSKISKLLKTNSAISPSLKLADHNAETLADMQKVLSLIDNNRSVYFTKTENKFSNEQPRQYRFENGVIPTTLKNLAIDLSENSEKCLKQLNKLYTLLMESAKDGDTKPSLAEPLLAEAGFLLQRLENLNNLWKIYAKTDSDKNAPMARWIEQIEGKRIDYLLSGSPIDIGYTLENMLWSQCEGAVVCSATILALNSFEHFCNESGLKPNDGTQYHKVTSPFDFYNNAKLMIPKMQYEPNAQQFTDELITKLPQLINNNDATLVLFSSYWQMNKVASELRNKHQLDILVQGEQARHELISKHKRLIDKKKGSLLFGTQSFSEGLDLVGDYLSHVIITKLPFSVPSSPIDEAQAEYISAQGGNPFMMISIPETSKKLVQATGRLLRNEKDKGVITLMDRRIISKRYGKNLLNSLPPYQQIIE